MANIKSQIKRVLITKEENKTNNSKRSRVKNAVKKYEDAIATGSVETAEKLLPETISIIDAATSDGIYHKNTASRKKSRLSKMLFTLKNPKAAVAE